MYIFNFFYLTYCQQFDVSNTLSISHIQVGIQTKKRKDIVSFSIFLTLTINCRPFWISIKSWLSYLPTSVSISALGWYSFTNLYYVALIFELYVIALIFEPYVEEIDTEERKNMKLCEHQRNVQSFTLHSKWKYFSSF